MYPIAAKTAVALAQSQEAHFWTADRRLADAAKNCGASWVQ